MTKFIAYLSVAGLVMAFIAACAPSDEVSETAEGVTQVARTADDQAQQTQTVASLADELVDGAREVATQVESVAEATNRQQTQVDSIEATLTRLAESDEEL